jgi:DNA-binding XRE family transcriptional regulator
MGTALEELGRRVRARTQLPTPEARRAIRVSAGVSLADIARAVGVTRQTAMLWERGARRPSGERLLAYVAVLEMLCSAVARDRQHGTPEMTEPGSGRAQGSVDQTDDESTG